MRILILGAAGQTSRMLTELIRKETDYDLNLFARNGHNRLKVEDSQREKILNGDFHDADALKEAMKDVDVVYLNDMADVDAMKNIVNVMEESNVNRLIGATVLGLYDEVGGNFKEWNERMFIHTPNFPLHKEAADVIEDSELNYTLLRLTWLYNEDGNEDYALTQKGETFIGAQVTRQAAARLALDIIQSTDGSFDRASVGVSEPNTDFAKPSFY